MAKQSCPLSLRRPERVPRTLPALLRVAPALLLLLLCCTVAVDAQSFFLKKCPKQNVVANFLVNKYLGKWYENRKYFAIFQAGGRCVTATYTNAGNGLIGVTNDMISLIGSPKSVKGQAKLADPSKTEAKLSVAFNSETPFADTATDVTDSNYWVLDTDYVSYSVVWSCSGIKGLLNTQFLWILTRQRDPPDSVLEKALSVVKDRGLDASKLRITDQNDC